MRDIKFRAWYDGRMYQPALVGGPQVPQIFNANHDLVNLCEASEAYQVMQFTGLEDKNGVEIYEGDIVRTHQSNNYTTTIKWREQPNGVGWNIGAGKSENREILGNIYENPGLLK